MQKTTIAILCGGRSAEHEVSIRSAKNVAEALSLEKYELVLIYITRSGHWRIVGSFDDIEHGGVNDEQLPVLSQRVIECLVGNGPGKRPVAVDVVFPVLHGPWGEDGTVQGLLEVSGVPYVGARVLGSSVGMDKDVMKRLLRDAGLKQANFLVVKKDDIVDYENVVKTLGSPVFIKPANLGSSVGISKAFDQESFEQALRVAFTYDTKLLIEEVVVGRELECAVLETKVVRASVVGEIVTAQTFYDYETKYSADSDVQLIIPANISQETTLEIQKLAIKVFQVLCCRGLARVDFFLKENGDVLVNEINTMPGFTSVSMYPKLWEESGVSYSELIDILIQGALNQKV